MTERDVPWLSEEEQHLWRLWLRVQTELPAALARAMSQDSELSMQDYETLVRLAETEGERLRISALAEQMHWERSRLSHHLRRMVSRGLIAKEECVDDGRGAFVCLAETGREALAAAAPGHVRAVRSFFLDGMDAQEMDALATSLRRLLDNVAPGEDQQPTLA